MSKKESPHQFRQRYEFHDMCIEQDYDPGVELITRRNELSDLAETYEELAADAAAGSDAEEKDKIPEYFSRSKELKHHVEQLDFKLMPFVYARKSSHTVGDSEGNSLLDAFANAVKGNLPKDEPVASTSTRH